MYKFKLPTICKACEEKIIEAVNHGKANALHYCKHTGMIAVVIAPDGIFVRWTLDGPYDQEGMHKRFSELRQHAEIISQHEAKNNS